MVGSQSGPKREQRSLRGGQWNKELTWASRPEADSYRTRSEGDVTKAAQIENLLGIYWEWS